jgi:hypothetical protein
VGDEDDLLHVLHLDSGHPHLIDFETRGPGSV